LRHLAGGTQLDATKANRSLISHQEMADYFARAI